MRLSRLNIAGFKSFPDRSELGFDDGVTAIVGPNGCGKSNVVDAITWVLGEQSAKSLRGERMEDVIFNGSEARKPTSAAEVRLKFTQVAQMAQASAAPRDIDPLLDEQPILTRDIEIGRRLYRSGESEYLIDGQACRLRDIHDLLMDSGLGVKAYAVIEQGKIGQILSSRPADRRMLIEEAAGVTKYKSRRRSAELKLEAAQLNLTRVDDIVFEVEKQRGALKRQAARARRYKRLREELRKWEQVQFARRYEALADDIASADARLEAGRVRQTAAAAHLAELENALEAVRLTFTEAEAQATASREQGHARELEIGRRQQQIAFDRQQIEDLAAQAAAFDVEASDLTAKRGPAAEGLDAARHAVERARLALGDAGFALTERESEYGRAQADVRATEQEADSARALVMAASTTLSALRQARDHASAVRDRVAAERERLDAEARDLEREVARAREQGELARRSLDQARSDLDRLVEARAAAEAALSTLQADRDSAQQALAVRERELAGSTARMHSLEELEVRRAAFGDAARLLLAGADDTLRHHGAVADHLQVERSYERAVDALLGDVLQYILVDRRDDVNAAFARVRDQNAGRCGFLVLEDASAVAAESSPVIVPPQARALTDVVAAVGPHASALSRLIGPALIVDSFDRARELARETRVPVATTSGEVFRGAWLVQGGARQDVRGILETRAEVLALREKVEAGRAELDALAADLSVLEDRLAAAQVTLGDVVGSQHDCEKSIVGAEAQAARVGDEQQRLLVRLGVVGTECAQAQEEQERTEARREEAVAAIALHETQQREAEGSLEAMLARLGQARDGAEACLRSMSQSRADQATLVERLAGAEADVVRLEEAGRDLEARIEGRRADIERTEVRRHHLRQSIADSERALDEDIRTLDRLKVEVRELDSRVVTLRDDMGRREQAIRGARHAVDDVRNEVTQLEVARATAAADLTHLEAACLESVGASLDDVTAVVSRMQDAGELVPPAQRLSSAVDDEDEDEPADAAEAGISNEEDAVETPSVDLIARPESVIQDLRGKIDRLGPVNMMAIEQFDELESRHLFLTTQRKDLLDSIAQTGEAIRKIDKTTRERFAEAFESINRHFERTFTTLFGGGRAGLVLIDQEDDSESGIDIIAQPPGKRLQNVQLLSGGEKALTAMALMFAVFKHRPSPFCLLDEIDAPLDDANIGRFIEMLQGMQEHTQFILITHNRKTMEIADRLYGVTMEEPGVSKLISLQLN